MTTNKITCEATFRLTTEEALRCDTYYSAGTCIAHTCHTGTCVADSCNADTYIADACNADTYIAEAWNRRGRERGGGGGFSFTPFTFKYFYNE